MEIECADSVELFSNYIAILYFPAEYDIISLRWAFGITKANRMESVSMRFLFHLRTGVTIVMNHGLS